MIFRKSCKNKDESRGIILIDILLALTLGAFFIITITVSSIDSQRLFERAQKQNDILDAYEAHVSDFGLLAPYESVHLKDMGDAYGSWYGNDRVMNRITVASSSMTFVSTRKRLFGNLSDFAGMPLCSVDLLPPLKSISITSIVLPFPVPLPLTSLEVRNGIAYISADSSTASDPDLIIADISNPAHAAVLSSLNTGPGIAKIALAGKRIYAAAASTAGQLHVIRLDGLTSPVLEKKYQLPLPYATATPPVASTIFYNNGRAYLGTDKWDGAEFNIINVSNPSAPARIGSMEIGSKVNDIFVRDGTAYVASSDQNQLRVVDVRDPVHPVLVSSFSPSGWARQEGKTISVFEDRVMFGRTAGGFNLVQDHELFSWATTSSTTLLTLLSSAQSIPSSPASVDIPGGVYGILRDRSHIYLATRQLNKELQIFDIPLNGTGLSSTTMVVYPLSTSPQSITCDGNKIYVLSHTAPVIYEISQK